LKGQLKGDMEVNRTIQPHDIGEIHKYMILNEVVKDGPVTRKDLAQRLGLSIPSTSRSVNGLLNNSVIHEYIPPVSGLGRKPASLEYKKHSLVIIAMSIMPRGIEGSLVDFDGDLLFNISVNSDIEKGFSAFWNKIQTVFESLLGLIEGNLVNITCAVPSLTNQQDYNNLLWKIHPEWSNALLEQYLFQRTGVKPALINDVELSLLGEFWKGKDRNVENMLFIEYGDGIAIRSMVDGNLLCGANSAAGEIQNLIPTFSSDLDFENYVCRHIFKDFRRDHPSLNKDNLFSTLLSEFSGDGQAEKIISSLLDIFSKLIVDLTLILNPQLIVLGGQLSYLREKDLDIVRSFVKKRVPFNPSVTCSSLELKSSVIGAAYYALRNAEENILKIWNN